jgi:hyperosmotically inducible protein
MGPNISSGSSSDSNQLPSFDFFVPNERYNMKTILTTTCFVIGAALAPVVAVAADVDKERSSTKEFVKDSVITAKIKAEMAKDKDVSATHIKVDTDSSGVVQLSGTAKSQAEVDKAITIAQNVKGVVSVRNAIQIQPR